MCGLKRKSEYPEDLVLLREKKPGGRTPLTRKSRPVRTNLSTKGEKGRLFLHERGEM
jgi:hypothetical protein